MSVTTQTAFNPRYTTTSHPDDQGCPPRQDGDTLLKKIKGWKAMAGERHWTVPASLFMAAAAPRPSCMSVGLHQSMVNTLHTPLKHAYVSGDTKGLVRALVPQGSPPDVLDVPPVPAVTLRWLDTQGIVALVEAHLNVAYHEDHPVSEALDGGEDVPVPTEDRMVVKDLPTVIEELIGNEDAPVPAEEPVLVEDPPVALEDAIGEEDAPVPTEGPIVVVQDLPNVMEESIGIEDVPVPAEDFVIPEAPPALPEEPVVVKQPVSLVEQLFQRLADKQVEVKQPVCAQDVSVVVQDSVADEEQPSHLERLLQRLAESEASCSSSLVLPGSPDSPTLVSSSFGSGSGSSLASTAFCSSGCELSQVDHIDRLFAPLIKKCEDTDELAVVGKVDVTQNKVSNKGKGRADDHVIQERTDGYCLFPGLDKMVREEVTANPKVSGNVSGLVDLTPPTRTRKNLFSAAIQSGPRTSTPAHSHGVIRGTGSGVHVPSGGSAGGSSGSGNLGAPSGVSESPSSSSVNVAVRTAPAARVPIKKALHGLGPNPDASIQGQQLIAQYRKASKPKKRKKPSGAQCQQEEHSVCSCSPSSVVNNVPVAPSSSSFEVMDSAVESEDVIDWPPYYVIDRSLNWDLRRPPPLYEAYVVNGKLKRYPEPGDGGQWYHFWSTPHDL